MYDAKAMKEQLQFDFTHCRLFRSGNADTTTFRHRQNKNGVVGAAMRASGEMSLFGKYISPESRLRIIT
jgi:hypothetical protein